MYLLLDCDYKCNTCEKSKTNCLSCISETRDLANNCSCNISYYEDFKTRSCISNYKIYLIYYQYQNLLIS